MTIATTATSAEFVRQLPWQEPAAEPIAELEFCDCPLGCASADRPVVAGIDRLHGLPGRFQVVQCEKCGLMRTNPRPTPEAIGRFYPADYSPHEPSAARRRSPLAAALHRAKPIYETLFPLRSDFLPAAPINGRMLEVGCATGRFLQRAAKRGWRVAGIEPSAAAAGVARRDGFEVFTGTIEAAPEPHELFDAVAAWMVVEHLHQPLAALEKLASWTRPGGWLALSVPNAGCWEFRRFGTHWYSLELPRHLFHFTPATIRRLLSAAGWQVEKIWFQRNLNNIPGSFGCWLTERQPRSWLGRWLLNFPAKAKAANYAAFPLACGLSWLGQTGRMTILARRPT